MQDGLIEVAKRRLRARLSDEAEARAVLEYLAEREGKTLAELVGEIAAPGDRAHACASPRAARLAHPATELPADARELTPIGRPNAPDTGRAKPEVRPAFTLH